VMFRAEEKCNRNSQGLAAGCGRNYTVLGIG
jgi:hypothetical protein